MDTTFLAGLSSAKEMAPLDSVATKIFSFEQVSASLKIVDAVIVSSSCLDSSKQMACLFSSILSLGRPANFSTISTTLSVGIIMV